MKALACFAIGVVVGVVLMKNNQAFDELQKELDREKYRNTSPTSARSALNDGTLPLACSTVSVKTPSTELLAG